MKGIRIILILLCTYSFLAIISIEVHSDDSSYIRGAFFYSPDCPCINQSIETLSILQINYTNFKVTWYNVDYDDNWSLSEEFFQAYNVFQDERPNYPFLFIGDHYFSNEKLTELSVSQILDSYNQQDVQLWPEWGNVKWTTCLILFYDSTSSKGLMAFDTIQSLNKSHLQYTKYDIYENPYNQSLHSLYLSAYNSSQEFSSATVFIGEYIFLEKDINNENIEKILLKYAGINTPCKKIINPSDAGRICVIVFYSKTCGECNKARQFLNEMNAIYPELNITYYDIRKDDNEVLKHSYCEHYGIPIEKRGTLVVLIGDNYFVDVDSLRNGFESLVIKYENGVLCTRIKPDEEIVIEAFESFNVIAIMVAGLIDGLNPCAFATLIFFISYLNTKKKSEKQIFLIGISFILGIFITYLLLGVGIFRGLETANEATLISIIIYPIAGILAFIFGSYSIYDYKKIKMGKTKEMVLKLPKKINNLIKWIIKKHANIKYFTIFAFITGMTISIFEFVCTGQVYLPTIIYILGVPRYRGQAFGYLLIYNIMFIVPIILIFIAIYFGVSDQKLKEILKKHVGLIKIFTALTFFILGTFMVILSLNIFGIIEF